MPEHEVCTVPFEECSIDLIGPWVIQVHENLYEFKALTVIDSRVMNLVELIRVDTKKSTVAGAYA